MSFLYVFWALLNVAAFVGLLIWLRMLVKRFGSLPVGLSLLVLVVMRQSTRTSPARKPILARFQTTRCLPTRSAAELHPRQLILADLTTCKLIKTIYLTRRGQSDSVFMTGFLGGFSWSSIQLHLRPQSARQIRYDTFGILEWQLPGLPIYKQPRQSSGYLTL